MQKLSRKIAETVSDRRIVIQPCSRGHGSPDEGVSLQSLLQRLAGADLLPHPNTRNGYSHGPQRNEAGFLSSKNQRHRGRSEKEIYRSPVIPCSDELHHIPNECDVDQKQYEAERSDGCLIFTAKIFPPQQSSRQEANNEQDPQPHLRDRPCSALFEKINDGYDKAKLEKDEEDLVDKISRYKDHSRRDRDEECGKKRAQVAEITPEKEHHHDHHQAKER